LVHQESEIHWLEESEQPKSLSDTFKKLIDSKALSNDDVTYCEWHYKLGMEAPLQDFRTIDQSRNEISGLLNERTKGQPEAIKKELEALRDMIRDAFNERYKKP